MRPPTLFQIGQEIRQIDIDRTGIRRANVKQIIGAALVKKARNGAGRRLDPVDLQLDFGGKLTAPEQADPAQNIGQGRAQIMREQGQSGLVSRRVIALNRWVFWKF